mgnify:CR=1 FL=1
MLMEGTILQDTVSRNLPNQLGGAIDSIKKGEVLRITDMESRPDGLWYYIGASGWVDGKLIRIDKDIEFMIRAKKLDIMDLQLFALGSELGGMSFVSSNDSPTSRIGIGSVPSIMGRSSGGGSFGGINNDSTISGTLGAFGVSMPMGGALGKAIGSQSIGSLSDGTFLSGVLGSLISSAASALDSLFSAFFQRLNCVVGFNLSAMLGSLFTPFASGSVFNNFANTSTSQAVKNYSTNRSYRAVDALAEHYFDYLGCGGRKKTYYTYDGASEDGRSFARKRSWETDETYYTETLGISNDRRSFNADVSSPEGNTVDANFIKNIYENVYDDFEEALEATKASLNLKITRQDWFINFNRFKLTHPDYHLTHSHQHIFMTRPDLNIFGNGSYSAPTATISASDDAAFFHEAVRRNRTLAMSLNASMSGNHDFIPIIHNTARSFDVQDESIETVEHGETLTGWKLVYAGNVVKSLTAGNFSISYVDDSKLSISYMHLIWLYYMNGVKRGIFAPTDDHIRNAILDYAASLYYIVTDATDTNIIFWTKYWGVFPTNYPSSSFSMSDGRPIATPEVSIQYAYSFKKDMDPVCLAEFNRNSQAGGSWAYVKPYNENILHSAPTIVGPPFIDVSSAQEDGSVTYRLRFREA